MDSSSLIRYELERLVNESSCLMQVYKNELQSGDQVLVKTLNSTYSIKVLEDGFYNVSGGWFDKQELSPVKIKVSGCTWGGSIIKTDIIAAIDLCLEFGNNVITSRIEKIFLIPGNYKN